VSPVDADRSTPWTARPDVVVHRAVATPVGPEARATLSAEERHRLDRLRRPGDGERFATGRVLARTVLGGLLGVAPRAVPLGVRPTVGSLAPERGGTGRPVVAGGPRLSIAHAGDVVLVAVDADPPQDADGLGLGVDVERLEAVSGAERLGGARPEHLGGARPGNVGAEHPIAAVRRRDDLWRVAAAPAELDALAALPEEERDAAFLALWTRKEAVLKACGRGLTVPMTALAVTLGDDPRVLRVQPGAGLPDPSRTLLAEVEVPAGHRAALALVVG
jgi:4'-phosphopantetheinyl transferase